MKKLLAAVLCAAMIACPALAEEPEGGFRNSSAEEITETLGVRFGYTDGISAVLYQTVGTLAQMKFDMNGVSYTARIQPTDGFEDISEFSFSSWAISDDCMIGWCDAKAMMAQQDGEIFALCLWYDAAPGLMYSVSARAEDLKGLDIQKAAEAVFAPMQGDADGLTSEDILSVLTDCTGYAGTAGSSLKNAIAACRLAAFAAEHALADMDEMLLTEAVAGALMSLTEEQREELNFNLQSMHGVLTEAFADYDGISGLFDDAGVADEMALLVAAERSFEHYEALHEQLLAAGL